MLFNQNSILQVGFCTHKNTSCIAQKTGEVILGKRDPKLQSTTGYLVFMSFGNFANWLFILSDRWNMYLFTNLLVAIFVFWYCDHREVCPL